MAHLYLSDEATVASIGQSVTVTGREARHAITVGRLAVGEQLRVGDGKGITVEGIVAVVSEASFEVRVESIHREAAPSPSVWLAQALAKGDRDELAIQAATELGVDGVIPWAATRSIVKWAGAKVSKQEQRWASILREASKQSMRPRIPEFRSLVSTPELARLGAEFHLVVLDPTGPLPLSSFVPDGRDIVIVVGPEGGVSPAELSQFGEAGASRVTLGPGILRTSTAGPVAMAILSVALGRW